MENIIQSWDDILCCTKDGKRYLGKICCIGNYKENKESEPEKVICINMLNGNIDSSIKIIKIADIMHICKIPLNDIMGFPVIDEERDKSNFINILVGVGFHKEGAEIIYESMREIVKLYNIPFVPILWDAISEIDVSNIDESEEERRNIINRCMTMMIGICQSTTDYLKEKLKNEISMV